MPRIFFECQKLVILKLHSLFYNMIYLDVPETVCFSSLEKLHLANLQFKDEDSLKKLLSGCPVLEEVYMKKIEPSDHGSEKLNLFVFSPSLKILRVDNPIGSYEFGSCYVVEAPKLEYLDFVEHSLLGFSMTASPSLVSAVTDIRTWLHYRSTFSVIELFQGISNVQNLELSTHKTIGFLGSESFIWSPPDSIPRCLTLHLEMIEILSLLGSYKEEAMKMIEYLLIKGKVLKKMAVTSFPDEKVFNKLMGFSKASVGCPIVFST